VLDLQSKAPAVVLIRRVEFDALLVELAREAGAEIVEGADVNSAAQTHDAVRLQTRDGRSFQARFVIAADGVHSVVARRLGIMAGWPRSALAIDMMEETPSSVMRARDPDSLWVSYGFAPHQAPTSTQLSAGYGYVFPKQGYVNVGLGYLVTDFRGSAPGNAYSIQRGFVDYLKQKRVLEGDSRRECFTPFLIPIAGPLRTSAYRRVLIAGDAAGFVNGSTAEGIYYAMVSGDLAARTLVGAVKKASPFNGMDYSTAWKAEIGAELRDSVAIQQFLFADSRRIDSVVHGAGARSGLTESVVRWLVGAEDYRRVRRLILTRNPVAAACLAAIVLSNRFPRPGRWI